MCVWEMNVIEVKSAVAGRLRRKAGFTLGLYYSSVGPPPTETP